MGVGEGGGGQEEGKFGGGGGGGGRNEGKLYLRLHCHHQSDSA